MHALWIILGTTVLIVGFVDVFLVVLIYDETGFLATRLCRWQWYSLPTVTRHLSRRRRPARYRQWLPFAYRAAQATMAVSLDLDYQPMLRIGG